MHFALAKYTILSIKEPASTLPKNCKAFAILQPHLTWHNTINPKPYIANTKNFLQLHNKEVNQCFFIHLTHITPINYSNIVLLQIVQFQNLTQLHCLSTKKAIVKGSFTVRMSFQGNKEFVGEVIVCLYFKLVTWIGIQHMISTPSILF